MAKLSKFSELKKNALDRYFGRMNEQQRQAIFTINGPVLILAGAGSGKTTVLVNRIANMVYFGDAYNNDIREEDATEDDLIFLKDFADGKETDAARLRDIVSVNPIKPWSVLAITFTNKAASELKSRIKQKLDNESYDVAASTFHSACAKI